MIEWARFLSYRRRLEGCRLKVREPFNVHQPLTCTLPTCNFTAAEGRVARARYREVRFHPDQSRVTGRATRPYAASGIGLLLCISRIDGIHALPFGLELHEFWIDAGR